MGTAVGSGRHTSAATSAGGAAMSTTDGQSTSTPSAASPDSTPTSPPSPGILSDLELEGPLGVLASPVLTGRR